MPFWNEIVEVLRESIFAYAQACNGNLGAGILAVTFLLRTALLPLGIHAARAAIRRQRATASPTPGNATPSRLERFTGIAPMPAFVALYAAVREASAAGGRFLWIGSLARPDWLLAIAATILTVAASRDDRDDIVQRFADVLRKNGPATLKCIYQPMPEETHATIYHPAALGALRRLFKP